MATIATTPKGGTVVYIKEGDATRLPKYRVSEGETLVFNPNRGWSKTYRVEHSSGGCKKCAALGKGKICGEIKCSEFNLHLVKA